MNPTTTRSNRFSGQVAIITGGASGIGKAAAERLGGEGAHVVLLDINGPNLRATRDEFGTKGVACEIHALDAADEEAVATTLRDIATRHGRIDVLVHCAGIAGPTGRKITEISVEDYDRVYRVNQRSAFIMAKHVLPPMLARGYGRILMFASIAGKEGNPGMTPYSSTKAAMIGLVKALGKEYAETGVTINGVAPAVIRTPLNEHTDPAQMRYMIEKIPMKRLGTVEEAAALTAWACSAEASYTTGFIHDLSGGRATY